MENTNQTTLHSAQISAQRYNQLQQNMWTGGKICQNANVQSPVTIDPYSQQINPYYQAQYSSQSSELNNYIPPISKDQNSNSVPYSQYPMAKQANYPAQGYQMVMKGSGNNNNNNMYYGNVNASKMYSPNQMVHTSKKYTSSNLVLSQAVPQSSQVVCNTNTPIPHVPHYVNYNDYSMQNVNPSNLNVHNNSENEQFNVLLQAQNASVHHQEFLQSVSLMPPNQVSQVSSIPTPPETSSLLGDGLPDISVESIKINVSSASFALPGSVNNMGNTMQQTSMSSMTNPSVMSNRGVVNALPAPVNLDEGSQASSASASSSIPDEQNSLKANSKPNFSYPPTPNTLSSPGAASMSSFHDELECISSPGWPKTPASPVANSSYEFANIKRPENLLKLYTLSDEPDRRYFLDKLITFNEDRGSPISQCPTISKQPLDVYRIYVTVKERGGFLEVTNAKRWKDIAGAIGVGASSSAAYTLRKQYMKLLLPFECKFDRGGIDPQPIINIVEASSRKKGKSPSSVLYGNQTHYGQNYSQPMDRYQSGYSGSFQPSRYPCNNGTDHQCPPNTMNYSLSVPTNLQRNSSSSQTQYNQYPQSSPANYRYYQGNNSASVAGYNSNMPNANNDTHCRFGRNGASTPVPQEEAYYSQSYSSSPTGHSSQSIFTVNRECSLQDSMPSSDVEQIASFQALNNAFENSVKTEGPEKSTSDNYSNLTSSLTLSESSQSSRSSFNSNFNSSKAVVLEQNTATNKILSPENATTQLYHQTHKENHLRKSPEMNHYSDNSTPTYRNQLQNSYVNSSSNLYPSHKSKFSVSKDILESNQYIRNTATPNECYRGSEVPSVAELDRNCTSLNSETVYAKMVPFGSSMVKPNSYAFSSSQQGPEHEGFTNAGYSLQHNNRSPRTWMPTSNQQLYSHVGQRMQFKNQVVSMDGNPFVEGSRPKKSWLAFQNSSQNGQQNNLTSMKPNLSLSANKSQPISCPSMTHCTQPFLKKYIDFPPNSIESIRPVAVKRRRCPGKRIGPIDPWRLMLALKSGLLTECTWALDAIGILLADNGTVIYFNLDHLPGLLNVLSDHYRCLLNKVFELAKDLEIQKDGSPIKKPTLDLSSKSKDNYGREGSIDFLSTSNFTYKTRCHKRVEIVYDEALFLIDPHHSWDTYEGFSVSSDHWGKGGGDITSHIQTCYFENTGKLKFSRHLLEEKDKSNTEENETYMLKSSLVSKGEPIVVLKKFDIIENKVCNTKISAESSNTVKMNLNFNLKKEKLIDSNSKSESISKDVTNNIDNKIDNFSVSKDLYGECKIKSEIVLKDGEGDKENEYPENNFKSINSVKTNSVIADNCLQIRGSIASKKRFLSEDLEDEAYCFDQPALSMMNDNQEMLSRRCVSVSTIIRNFSFVPGNDVIMSKHSSVLALLGRLLLLHHDHKPVKNAYHKYEKTESDSNIVWNDSCVSLQDKQEWWWSTLNVLRDNAFVTLSNVSCHLDLSKFPEEVSLPILDGLLHWVVCPSSHAQDPLPSRSPSSVLSPQRLCLETLCKLSVFSDNVDLILATPPWSRIENLFSFLTKCLCLGQDQIMREFSVVLLSNISEVDTAAARTIALQNCCISYLISFLEEAEANAFQIASSEGTKKLRDKPELMGTTPGMLEKAACTLKNLALVPENQVLFFRYQSRLLSLVMSQVMEQELLTIVADVLFYCSDDAMEVAPSYLPFS